MPKAEANAVRWTPRRIRAALKCPKPAGAIIAAEEFNAGRWPRARDVVGRELRLLRHICENGDLIFLPTADALDGEDAKGWLLVPLALRHLHDLATVEADLADLEPDHDREDDGTAEDGDVDEDDGSEEENVDDMRQLEADDDDADHGAEMWGETTPRQPA